MNFNTKSMSNYPVGADNDPNAPWNRDDSKHTEKVEKYTSELASYVASWFYTELSESVKELDIPSDVEEEVYEEIYNRAKQIWEQ